MNNTKLLLMVGLSCAIVHGIRTCSATQATQKKELVLAYKRADTEAAQEILSTNSLSIADAQWVLGQYLYFTQRRSRPSNAARAQVATLIEQYIRECTHAEKNRQKEWHEKEKAKNRDEFQRKALKTK